MSERDTIREALYDAIGWQLSFADANAHTGGPEYKEALAQVKKYRALLRKRYGEDRLPIERAFEGATLVSVHDIRAAPPLPTTSEKRKDAP